MLEIDGLFAYRTPSRAFNPSPQWTIAGYAKWLVEPFGRTEALKAETEVLALYRFTDAALAAGRQLGWSGAFAKMPRVFGTDTAELGLIWEHAGFTYVVSEREIPQLDAAELDEAAHHPRAIELAFPATQVPAMQQPVWIVDQGNAGSYDWTTRELIGAS